MESSLFPETELRPSRRSEAGSEEAASRAPALPELPPSLPDPPHEAAPAKQVREPAASVPAAEQGKRDAPVTTCPRCEGKLVDAAGLGWCQGCGYCHSLEQDRVKVPVKAPAAARKARDPGLIEFLVLLTKIPSWFWVMVAGCGAVVAFTSLTAQPYRGTPFARCVWCTVQIGISAVIVFLASFWALLHVAADDENMTAKDVFLPIRLWGLTCQRLPRTRWQVCLAVWGVTGIIAAAVLVGGLGEWFKHLPKPAASEISGPAITRNA